MRVEGPKPPSEISSKKASSKTEAAGDFGALIQTTAAKTGQASRTGASANISALIAVQAADDVEERQRRKRQRARGDALLKALDSLRVGLMTGAVSRQHLQTLAALLSQARERLEDPRLQEILDEIELRAAVELAKLECADDNAAEHQN